MTAARVGLIGARRRRQGLGPFVARDLVAAGASVPCFLGTSEETLEAARRELEERAGGRFPLARLPRPNAEDGRVESAQPRFSVGARVLVRDAHQPGHTRAPKYVRSHSGVVVHVAPGFTYPDANAHGLPIRREPTYHVEFEAAELWAQDAEAADSIVVDLWESYLEQAT